MADTGASPPVDPQQVTKRIMDGSEVLHQLIASNFGGEWVRSSAADRLRFDERIVGKLCGRLYWPWGARGWSVWPSSPAKKSETKLFRVHSLLEDSYATVK